MQTRPDNQKLLKDCHEKIGWFKVQEGLLRKMLTRKGWTVSWLALDQVSASWMTVGNGGLSTRREVQPVSQI